MAVWLSSSRYVFQSSCRDSENEIFPIVITLSGPTCLLTLMSDHQSSGSKHSGSSTCNLPNVHLYTKMTNYHLFVKGTSEATLTIFWLSRIYTYMYYPPQ